jgi:hypothetical protein
MMSLSLSLYGVAAFGTLVVASIYLFGSVPTSHHREILEKEGLSLSPGLEQVMTSLCRVLGAGLMASGVSALLFALAIQASDPVLIKMRPLLIGLIIGVPSVIYPHRVEMATGVRTPWRSAVGLLVVMLAGFVASLM